MRRLANIFVIALWWSFDILPSIHALKSDSEEAVVKLISFEIDLRSKEMSDAKELASLDLKRLAESHISNFIIDCSYESSGVDIWRGFESISLNAEDDDTSIFRRLNLRRNSRKVHSNVYFEVKYIGSLTFSSDSISLPTTAQVEEIVEEAFLGKGRLNFLRSLRASQDVFLSTTNYVKVLM